MAKVLMVAAGGAAGAVLRYAIAGWTQRLASGSFPVGTLAVNVVGCFLIGFLGVAFSRYILIREEYRLALTIGLLGAFTTFSTYGWETFSLMNDGQKWQAALNLLASNAFGLAGVWLGFRLAERWYGA
ncbi:MAG: fluoride efflux transporter CrcB [Candidatus Hydrogenedentes bacterium]|nr:fluoride efflux transporter CrcB [Candidatus Hydrogenedentota bacterium]